MATQINEGEALIVGRGSRETAIALLKAADDVGAPVESVRTVMDGFVVPSEVADKYEESVAEKDRQEVRRFEEDAEQPTNVRQSDTEPVTDSEIANVGLENSGDTTAEAAVASREQVDAAGESGSSEDEGDKGAEVPAKSADKPTWVDYAKTQGYDESEGLTKDQLIERYGVSE